MLPADLPQQILSALIEVAPDADAAHLDPDQSFRDQFEIDSLDFLNLILSLEKRLGIKIPEGDYPKLSSLNGAVRYLAGSAGDKHR